MKTFKCKYCSIEKTVPNYRKDKFCSKKCASIFNFFQSSHSQQIIDSFKEVRSYTNVGKLFYLSKQRIEQIIKKYAPELVQVKSKVGRKYFSKIYGLPCLHCRKKLNVEVEHNSNQYCINCRYYYNNSTYQPKIK